MSRDGKQGQWGHDLVWRTIYLVWLLSKVVKNTCSYKLSVDSRSSDRGIGLRFSLAAVLT